MTREAEIFRDALLSNVYKNQCPKCKGKTFTVKVSEQWIDVICQKCKRNFLGCWNEWVLNTEYD